MFKKGQIQLGLASGMAAISFVAAPIMTFYATKESLKDKIGLNTTNIAVHEEKLGGICERLDRIENKLDLVLDKQNISYKQSLIASSTYYGN